MKQEKEVEEYKKILETEFKRIKEELQTDEVKIDSEFIERYFGKIAQAKLGMKIVNDFEDALLMNGLAGMNCVELGLDFSGLSPEEFAKIPFDSRTIFSEDTIKQFNPAKILEEAKKFGSGLEKDSKALTGKGIHVAVMDQNCNPSLTDAEIVEYEHLVKIKDEEGNPIQTDPKCSIISYTDTEMENGVEIEKITEYACYDYVRLEDTEHMHGLTVTSLLASKSCGVAKDAKVHFYAGRIERTVENIKKHNMGCKEEDKILVLSVSERIDGFEEYQEELRQCGCEIVCANNFDKNFNEYTDNGDSIEIPLDLTEDELDILRADFEKYYAEKISRLQEEGRTEEKEKIRKEYEKRKGKIFIQMEKQIKRKDNVKIPTAVTYHQVGQNGFKYQSSYSTSWGIPQIAGLLATFKQLDRSLTFKEFCEIAKSTSIGEYQIINPKGIYEEIERRCHFIPMEHIENAISQAKIGRTEINQEIGLIRDKIQGRDEKTNSNTEERE